jgi:hypothetical protein
MKGDKRKGKRKEFACLLDDHPAHKQQHYIITKMMVIERVKDSETCTNLLLLVQIEEKSMRERPSFFMCACIGHT